VTDVITPNESLLMEADSYDVIPTEELSGMFVMAQTLERTPPPEPLPADVPKVTARPEVATAQVGGCSITDRPNSEARDARPSNRLGGT
jgi:hypothetical protein